MLRSNFFKRRERNIEFFSVEGENSWEPVVTPMATVSGLCRIVTPGTLPESGSEAVNGVAVCRFKTAEGLEDLKVGDRFEVEGITYSVQRFDLSGTQPTDYPIRVEGNLR